MSDLQITFLVFGALLFAGVAAYSWFQSQPEARRTRKTKTDDLFTKFDEGFDEELEDDFAELEEAKPEVKSAKTVVRKNELDSLSESGNSPKLDTKSSQKISTESASKRAARTVAKTFGSLTGKARVNRRVRPKAEVESVPSQTAPAPSAPKIVARAEPSEPLQAPLGANSEEGIVTDLVARIKIKSPLEQNRLVGLLRQHDFKFHRTIHLYGLNQLTDRWCDIEQELSSAQFVDLGLSIQLADRHGAMSSKEAHDFQQMVLQFTDEFDAPFDFSMDIDAALNQAQCLDKIGMRFDSMAVLNIVPKSRSGFRVADVESCARDLIMSPDQNQIFLKTTGQRNDLSVQYRLACSDGKRHLGISEGNLNPIHDLVFYMNVPATSNPELVFQEMIDDANKLATWLEGKVVDVKGRALTQRALNALLAKVSEISSGLRALGIQPGDAVSRKLF